ncbi:MAG TPA: Gfo/Idh/MocA family oxidoreductase [Gemmatimonadales bacterium]|nr:Gfo/Idh/MocA family oxidoreductase [Gemmatimonadales bacterium]
MRLGIGFIGSGFNARLHLQAFQGVRDADVLGVWSPNPKHAEAAAAYARSLDVGPCRPYRSIGQLVTDPQIQAIWLCGPNHARIENLEEIVDPIRRGHAELQGIACEKPLARHVAEARQVIQMARQAGVRTGYLENQVFAPAVETGRRLLWAQGAPTTGRPYLARVAEEHRGPHRPWFWRGKLHGGGVVTELMCHAALVVRYLLTRPGDPLATVKPVRITGHMASLKWTRREYARRLKARMGTEVDYVRHPAEDFASLLIEFETADGHVVAGEATTSWTFVGAGRRLSAELLGPEYSLSWNALDTGLTVFFSREVKGQPGEDRVERPNAETGLMPVEANEAAAYGYEAEDRHFVRAFLGKEDPRLTFEDGLEVVRVLMAAYLSAEQGKTLRFPPPGLDTFVPQVAKGAWKSGK